MNAGNVLCTLASIDMLCSAAFVYVLGGSEINFVGVASVDDDDEKTFVMLSMRKCDTLEERIHFNDSLADRLRSRS